MLMSNNELRLQQLKLHAFGHIDSAQLTSLTSGQGGTRPRGGKHRDIQTTTRSDETRRAENSTRRNVSGAHPETSTCQARDHAAVGPDKSPSAAATTESRRASAKLVADVVSPGSVEFDVGLQLGDVSQSRIASSSILSMTSSMTSSRTGSRMSTESDRRRQRENVEMIRLFTAQAEAVVQDVASAVDQEYMALPASSRPPRVTRRSRQIPTSGATFLLPVLLPPNSPFADGAHRRETSASSLSGKLRPKTERSSPTSISRYESSR